MDPKVPDKKATVETYTSDIAGALQGDQAGLVRKIIREEEERESAKKNISPGARLNKFLVIVSALLIVLGLGALSYLFLGERAGTGVVKTGFVPLVFTDRSSFLEVAGFKRSEIIQSVWNQVRDADVKQSGILGIYLTYNKELLGLRQFLLLTKSNFAPGENPAVVSDNFMLGAVKGDADTGFFILLKTRTIEDIFDPMRAWEKKMFYDLYEFLGFALDSSNKYLLTKIFEDGLVENKNARLLYDNEWNVMLMYVLADNNSVVIADSTAAAREVMLRLRAKQTKE